MSKGKINWEIFMENFLESVGSSGLLAFLGAVLLVAEIIFFLITQQYLVAFPVFTILLALFIAVGVVGSVCEESVGGLWFVNVVSFFFLFGGILGGANAPARVAIVEEETKTVVGYLLPESDNDLNLPEFDGFFLNHFNKDIVRLPDRTMFYSLPQAAREFKITIILKADIYKSLLEDFLQGEQNQELATKTKELVWQVYGEDCWKNLQPRTNNSEKGLLLMEAQSCFNKFLGEKLPDWVLLGMNY